MLHKVLLVFASLAFSAAPLDAQQPESDMPPLTAYGELPRIERAALSPSGDRIAALMTVNGQRMIALLEDGERLIIRYNVDDMKIRNFDWIGENMVLLVYSETERLGRTFTTDKHEFARLWYFLLTHPSKVAQSLENSATSPMQSSALTAHAESTGAGMAFSELLSLNGAATSGTTSSMADLISTEWTCGTYRLGKSQKLRLKAGRAIGW